MRPLSPRFYARPTLDVAPDLLGRMLLVNNRGRLCGGRIVETEAYIGENDPACHARHGLTKRTRVMYGPPGHAYVYFTYGNHWMLNFVTEREGFPAAVLIRAIEPLFETAQMQRRRNVSRHRDLTNGPGKLTQALAITGDDNGTALQGPRLTVGGPADGSFTIATSGRVGVGDGEGSAYPWRFVIDGNPWVSAYRLGRRSPLGAEGPLLGTARRKTALPECDRDYDQTPWRQRSPAPSGHRSRAQPRERGSE